MFELRSGSLTVSVLDPVADQHLLSSAEGYRYCSGGYIWQATDALHGELLTGPNGDAPPGVTNGQGFPDSFNLRPIWDGFYAGKTQEAPAGHALIIGIGEVDLNYEHDPALPDEAEQAPHGGITKLCRWDIERSGQQVVFRTAHAFGQYNLELVKTVALSGRTLRTTVAIKNLGAELPFTWFPKEHGDSFACTEDSMRLFWSSYLGPDGDGHEPYASPIRAATLAVSLEPADLCLCSRV